LGKFFIVTVIAAIPARYAATRLPGKPLLELAGRPLIAHVVAAALRVPSIDQVLVATDHEGIAAAARLAGAEAVMTASELPSGSDRIGAALAGREYEIAVNIQGDEPELDVASLDALVCAMQQQPDIDIGTLSTPLVGAELNDPNAVKVVVDGRGFALYFSRAALAADRDALLEGVAEPSSAAHRHIGVYAYRKAALERFLLAPPSPLERFERLEQLRALEMGMRIRVLPSSTAARGIDTPNDLEAARRRLTKKVDS